MKAFTLAEYISKKNNHDTEFASYYAREQVINNIAEMIVEARKNGCLTQSELAQRIGTTQSVISRIESGNSSYVPSLDTLLKIAEAMHLKLQLKLKPC